MVSKHDQKIADEKEGKKITASAKQPKSKPAIEKSSKPAPTPKPKETNERSSKAFTAKPPKPKPAKEKLTKTTPPQQVGKGKIAKVHKVKSPLQLVDKPGEEPAQLEPEPELKHQGEGEKDDMECAIQIKATQLVLVVERKIKARLDTGRTLASRPLPELVVMDEDQARPDPGESRGVLAGPDLESMHDEFMANLYPKRVEDFQLSIESYQKQLNLTKSGWDAKGFEYKHDYTIIESPRAVVFPVDNNEQKIMRFNEFTNSVMKIRVIPKYHSEDGNPARPNIKQAIGRSDTYNRNPVKEILLKIESTRSQVGPHRIWSKDRDGDTSFQWSLFHKSVLILDRIKVKGTSRTMNNQAFTIKRSMSMLVQFSQAQDGETP
uniref:Uncharacterized protein n=1 Tax=Tanacetum cinerariifolium TaxID=118510 RepID=A0A6L2N033_TANCI|nr:hypothetical protein [Tanacetum cinerariifolium]